MSGSYASNASRSTAQNAILPAYSDKQMLVTKRGVTTWGTINDALPTVGVTSGQV